MADADFQNPTHDSIWKVTRQLKKEQCSLYNCVASVFSDAAFVSELHSLYSGIPLLANLRCGLWYTRQADGTCYFKSTDGHNGNWSFSCTRLNWHVCETAAKHGGVIIVDATRKGKRFPDAMTKTIPIWTAVINRAVARKRAEAAERHAAEARARSAAVAVKATSVEEASVQQQHVCFDFQGGSAIPITDSMAASEALREWGASSSCSPSRSSPSTPVAPGHAAGRLSVRVPRGMGCGCGNTAGLASPSSSVAGSPVGSESEGCARVGSLSQWLNSPVALSEWEATRSSATRFGSQRRLAAISSLAISSSSEVVAQDDALDNPDATRREPEPAAESAMEAAIARDGRTPPWLPSGTACHRAGPEPAAIGTGVSGSSCCSIHSGHELGTSDAPAGAQGAGAIPLSALTGGEDFYGQDWGHIESQVRLAAGPVGSGPVEADPERDADEDADAEGCGAPSCALAGRRIGSSSSGSGSSCSASSSRCASRADSCCTDQGEGDAQEQLLCPSGSSDDLCRPSPSSDSAAVLVLSSSNTGYASDGGGGDGGWLVRSSEAMRQESVFAGYSSCDVNCKCNCANDCDACSGTGGKSDRDGCCPDYPPPSSSFTFSLGLCKCKTNMNRGCGRASLFSAQHGCCGGLFCPLGPSPERRRQQQQQHPQSGDSPAFSSSLSNTSSQEIAAGMQAQDQARGPCVCGRWGGFTTCSPCRRPTCNSAADAAARSCCARTGTPGVEGCRGLEPPGLAGAQGVGAPQEGGLGAEWDTELHLPLWISSNERAQIERRLDGWVESLLRVGADVEGLAKILRKPLRPLWISQASTIWVDQVAQPDQLPFTPLYLVSASQPNSYVRQTTNFCCGVGAAGGSGTSSDADTDPDREADAGAADPDGAGRSRRLKAASQRPKCRQLSGPAGPCDLSRRPRSTATFSRTQHCHRDPQQQQHHHAWTYVYVPGAGDDEESWAAGLTPAVFWAHCATLLRAGPASIHDVVRKLLQEEAATLAERGTNSSIVGSTGTTQGAAHAAAAADEAYGDLRSALSPEPTGTVVGPSGAAAPATAAYIAETDEHHLLPAGCRAAGFGAPAGGAAGPGPCGMYFLGATRIALGDLAAAAAPECWKHVDAVLSCGTTRHPSMLAEPQWPLQGARPAKEDDGAAGSTAALFGVMGGGGGVGMAAPAAEGCDCDAAGSVVCRGGYWVCGSQSPAADLASAGDPNAGVAGLSNEAPASCPEGDFKGNSGERSEQAVTVLQLNAHHHHHHDVDGDEPRYLHLPIQHFKHNRASLAEHLEPALRFLSHHLSRGRRVLIHDTNGLDTCVCVAVALLLSCYGPCGGGADGSGPLVDSEDSNAPEWVRPYSSAGNGLARGMDCVSKDGVRQRLAFVSACYPPARPTRGMLRQVFNHFVQERTGDGDIRTRLVGTDEEQTAAA